MMSPVRRRRLLKTRKNNTLNVGNFLFINKIKAPKQTKKKILKADNKESKCVKSL